VPWSIKIKVKSRLEKVLLLSTVSEKAGENKEALKYVALFLSLFARFYLGFGLLEIIDECTAVFSSIAYCALK